MADKDYKAELQSSNSNVSYTLVGKVGGKPNTAYIDTIVMHGVDGQDVTYAPDKPFKVEITGSGLAHESADAVNRLMALKTNAKTKYMPVRLVKAGDSSPSPVTLTEVKSGEKLASAGVEIDPRDRAMLASLSGGPDSLVVPSAGSTGPKGRA